MKEIDYSTQWNQYYPKVYGYFFRRVSTRQDVEDLTSISMSIYFDKLNTTQITNEMAYLWKISHFQLLNYIKNKSKSALYVSVDPDFEPVLEIEECESDYLKSRKVDLMHCIKNNSSQQDYEIIQQIVIEEKKAPEIAQELSLKADLVRQRFHRAIKKLRTQCAHVWNK